MSKRSTICFKRNGDPMMEYDSLPEAEDGGQFILANFNNQMTPYRCNTCDKFHLILKGKVPIPDYSACRDRAGWAKDSYESEEDAERQADYLYNTIGVILRAYYCYKCDYWHLTSH